MPKQQVVYGLRPVMEAIESGVQIDKILIQNGLSGNLVGELKAMIREAGLPFQYVPVEKLEKVTRNNHQGVVATVSPVEYQHFMDVVPLLFEQGKTPFILLLDHVTDVRNMGAIVRTAECAGVDAVVVPDHGSAQLNEDAIKTSSGALLRVPICREQNLKTVVNFAKQSGLQVVAATEKGSKNYLDVDFKQPTLLVMGSEETGISNEVMKLCDVRAKLPIRGEVQSLNVGVAAGIFMYEVLRQRS
ncbi:MAG: 23S rRNA (guanosine(2251)-2'-O)-methyltransferase RlmB [Bacteroidales bacterium]|nr:23S rRNA (guanosine(2251)-2'-O)-methyltransferase RlmB [Bacteroidales bacterium]